MEPRALFATTEEGHTVLLYPYDSGCGVSAFAGYVTPAPTELFAEDFGSLDEALGEARRRWRLEPAAFRDVRLGRQVAVDFAQALRRGSPAPLHVGMPSRAVVELLGVPARVQALFEPGCVCWFYGSVQLLLRGGELQRLEIDNGEGDFTSLQFTGWFLERSTTKRQLEDALKARDVASVEETFADAPVLRVPGPGPHRGFTFDFHHDTGRIHALYWNV